MKYCATGESKRGAKADRTYRRSTARVDHPARTYPARCQASWTGFACALFLANRLAASDCSGLKGSVSRRAAFATLTIPGPFAALGKDLVSRTARRGNCDQLRGQFRYRGSTPAGGTFERSVDAPTRPTLGNPLAGIRLARTHTAAPFVSSAGGDMTAPGCISRETLR